MQTKILLFEASNNPFEAIYVDITHRCQMACANCYLPNRDFPDMDLARLTEVLKELPKKTDIRLIGGEPTLRDDLETVIGSIASLGHRPMLITNALKLSNLEYCKKLKAAGLEYAQISLNGFNDDKIYQVIDNMKCAKNKMDAISNCEKAGIGVSISMIVIKGLNDHLIEEVINFAHTLKKPARVNFRNVGDLGRSMINEIQNFSYDELIEKISLIVKIPIDEIKKHVTANHQLRLPIKTGPKRSEVIWIKITDWNNYPLGVVDLKMIEDYSLKGRITQNFKLAPFFEHVKENEFGY